VFLVAPDTLAADVGKHLPPAGSPAIDLASPRRRERAFVFAARLRLKRAGGGGPPMAGPSKERRKEIRDRRKKERRRKRRKR